jgi:hypothetical protein
MHYKVKFKLKFQMYKIMLQEHQVQDQLEATEATSSVFNILSINDFGKTLGLGHSYCIFYMGYFSFYRL